jgi:competence ComEA-like helix-hairpin-helix protein
MRDIKQNEIQSFAFVISVFIAVCLSWTFASTRTQLESVDYKNRIELESRINPNDASIASLLRLPDIGMLRASAIVAYRQDSCSANGGNKTFQDINDLQNVKGIGPKTAQNISQWLTFE